MISGQSSCDCLVNILKISSKQQETIQIIIISVIVVFIPHRPSIAKRIATVAAVTVATAIRSESN